MESRNMRSSVSRFFHSPSRVQGPCPVIAHVSMVVISAYCPTLLYFVDKIRIRSSVDGTLCCFRFLAVHNSAVNISLPVTSGAYVLFPCPWTPGSHALLSVQLSVAARTLTELILLGTCQPVCAEQSSPEFYIVKKLSSWAISCLLQYEFF